MPDRQTVIKPGVHPQMREGFRCRCDDGYLFVEDYRGFESRNLSTIRLIGQALEKYAIRDFDWIYVYTGDADMPNTIDRNPVFRYATCGDDYHNLCPDFLFDAWPETSILDYEQTRLKMARVGQGLPLSDKLGWRGACTHPNRRELFKYAGREWADIQEIVWNRQDPSKLTCHNFVSFVEAPSKWRYLIDVEGSGWSARLKLLMFSQRLIFLQSRPFNEWFMPSMKPWIHYVPVNRDLSDLAEQFALVRNDTNLEISIRQNAYKFALANLTREAALRRWRDLLIRHWATARE